MRRHGFSTVVELLALVCLGSAAVAGAVTASSAKTGISAHLDQKTGQYQVAARNPQWSFTGSLGSAASSVKVVSGRDAVGAYQEIGFAWRSGPLPLRGAIRVYQARPAVLFSYTYLIAASPPAVAFPGFTEIPAHLYH
ncbi:MAG: hypothetical protein ACRD3O_09585, partial [Terriglobia bacterium]